MNETGIRDGDHEMLIAAVHEAGALASSHFGKSNPSWMKKPGQPVSEVDLAVDDLLRQRLCGERSDYGWLSEESAETPDRMDREWLWVVDPIDGTRAFLDARPEYSVSAALLHFNRPVAAAVFNPETDEFFEAVHDGGARCNGEPITVSAKENMDNARVLVSRSEFKTLAGNEVLIPCEVSSISSIAYKLALVGSGATDATVTLTAKSDWDIVAAHLIVSEAGGIMTLTDGEALVYNRPHPRHPNVLAAGPGLHAMLATALKET
ncbi:MAG: 3'(2'),5'-bisphosphate nucleotidase CysQ [Alphaproteobacteria bacterium]|nr:3'(2'),5'-bisphosphate nucleotidase CysQ [Alphaproteobacteria bacterium]